jgi:hypothetical protein
MISLFPKNKCGATLVLRIKKEIYNFYINLLIINVVVLMKKALIKLNQKIDSKSFILANLDVSGFYRVNYDLENWNKIISQLLINHKVNMSDNL